MANKAKKLYYDLIIPNNDSVVAVLTEVAGSSAGDRYGNLLAAVPAATNVTSAQMRQRNEITAIFVPRSGLVAGVAGGIELEFCTVNETVSPAFAAFQDLAAIPAGASAVGLQNPCVKVRFVGGSGSVSGTLYVQRQHSIEA